MAEQWSSKSYMWVRFLLPLLIKVKNIKFLKKKYNIKNRKIFSINFLKKNNLLLNLKISNKNFFFNIKKNNTFFFIWNNKLFSTFNSTFFLIKHFFFFTTKNFNTLLSKNNFIFFYSFTKSLFSSFIDNFVNFLYKLNNSFVFLINKNNNIYLYYYFYLNIFIFLNIKTIFVKNIINTTNINIFNKIRFNKIFNKNNKLIMTNDYITNVNLNFIIKYFFIKKYFKLHNNILKKNNIFLKLRYKNLIKFFSFSKFFFIFLNNNFKKKFIKSCDVFKLSKYDWLSDDLAKLTKNSIKFNTNDFIFFMISHTFKNNNLKLIKLFNLYNYNDVFFENNFFIFFNTFDKFFNKKNKFNKFNNKFFLKNINTHFNFSKNFLPHPQITYKKNFLKLKSVFNISNNKFLNLFYKFNKFEIIILFFFKPLFLKFITLSLNSQKFNYNNIISYVNNYFFYSSNNIFFSNNILPNEKFFYIIRKKMLKTFNYNKFSTITSVWKYNTLIRFLEFCSGKKIYLKFNTFLNNNLNFYEKTQCLMWSQKVKYFRKVLGPRLFLNESLQIIYLALKLKDPYFLSNWIVSTMQKISFWKYKTFLRYLKYVLRYFFWIIFKQLNIKGIKFQLKGKISVAGNARTRTVRHSIGFTSHATFNNKILYKLNLVRTFTGVLGLKLWIVF